MTMPDVSLFDALHTRRSIRKFAQDPIPQEHVRAMLGAAMTAPSSGNTQPWHFVVVTDRAKLDRIGEQPNAHFSKQAPLAILVCGDTRMEKYPDQWIQDCSAATQNILLAAYGLGYGSCWCGVYPKQERVAPAVELFNIPDYLQPLAWIVIGKPLQDAERLDRYNKERVVENSF